MKMRVIFAGGRDFNDLPMMIKKMNKILSNKDQSSIVIVSGGAKGADSLGEKYAALKGYPVAYYPADWDKYGKSAGYRRNEEMANNADALVAFWDGKSKGTNHMIELAKAKGLPTRVIHY